MKVSDQFMTPPYLIDAALQCMGSIDLDPASNPVAQTYVNAKFWATDVKTYAKHCHEWDDVLNDGLHISWTGNVWCNPPYSSGLIDQFTKKTIEEWNTFLNPPQKILYLVNSQTDTKWYHSLLQEATAVLLFRGRIKFWKIDYAENKALEKWEGLKSIEKRALDPTIKPKIGNSPRYLSSLFFFGRDKASLTKFREVFSKFGTILDLKTENLA